MGRKPYRYEEVITQEIRDMIPKWKRMGNSDTYIAKQIGIGLTTLKKWKNTKPQFYALFAEGREQLLADLEESQYKKARGYKVQLKSYAVDSETGEVLDNVININEKYIHSDSALKNSLARLDPKHWSKKALEGEFLEDSKEDKIIFSGEDDL
jgi:hypothetical protein